MTRKERIILLILASLNFTHILDFMIMMPLGNYLLPHFQISARFFSWIVASYPVTACVSGLIAAFYVDQYDRKKVLLFAYSGFLIGTLCCGIAPDPYFLMAARILTGFFGGLIGAQVLSIIADTFPYEKRGRAMGTVFMAFSLASVFGVPFSLYLANLVSWHAPFIFIAIVGLPIIVLIAKFLPAMQSHLVPKEDQSVRFRPDVKKVVSEIFRNDSQLMALALSGLLMMGHFLIIPFINPYMEFNLGFRKDQTPLIYMVGGVCALVSSSIIGRLADRHGKYQVFSICLLLSLIPIFFITRMPAIPFYAVLAIFWFLVYFFNREKYSGTGHDYDCRKSCPKGTVHEFQLFLSAVIYRVGFHHRRIDRYTRRQGTNSPLQLGGLPERSDSIQHLVSRANARAKAKTRLNASVQYLGKSRIE